jgi:hypothetical protein
MRGTLFVWMLASMLLCWSCDAGDDDDSGAPPGDDDTTGGDDDDTTPGDDDDDDDDTTPGDDDDSSATDDDDTTGDDDDTTNPALLTAEVTWIDTGVPGDPLPTLALADLGGGDLQVDRTAWQLNCCIDLIVGAAAPATGICRINIDDIGTPCYCESGMDVQVMVHGVDPGSTDVTVVYGVDQVATGTVELAP